MRTPLFGRVKARHAVPLAMCVAAGAVLSAQLGQVLPERQLPIFRADSHFVRVDAYPTNKDGSIIQNLTAEDFEIHEDGKLQRVDSAEYIAFERWSPGVDPPSAETQRESFRLAADPRYRVVVVYVNRLSRISAQTIRQPLIDLLTREVGPRDLYGLLLPYHEASDLVLAKFTPAEQARLTRFLSILDHSSPFDMDPVEQKLLTCFGQSAVMRWRQDNLYRDLEGIISILGTLRDERKSLILVTESMPGSSGRLGGSRGGGGGGGGGGSGMPFGGPPMSRPMPGATGISTGIFNPSENVNVCDALARDLPPPDPDRFDNLIKRARSANVAISPVNPVGLTANATVWTGAPLRRLADETDGIPIVNVNDIKGGLKKIANDMPAYYLLGYYTTNTKWDGRRREIKVKLKSTGKTIRARREYQAPSEAEVAAMRAAAAAPPRPPGPTPIERALNDLARLRTDADLHVQGAVRGGTLAVAVEIPLETATTGRWFDGADVEVSATSEDSPSSSGTSTTTAQLRTGARGVEVRLPIAADDDGPWQVRAIVKKGTETLEDRSRLSAGPVSVFGAPLLYRAASPPAAPFIAAADRQFQRNERLRAEWMLSTPAQVRVKARLLQPNGRALSYAPPVVTEERGTLIAARVEFALTPIAAGDYLIELVAEVDGTEQSTLLAVRIK